MKHVLRIGAVAMALVAGLAFTAPSLDARGDQVTFVVSPESPTETIVSPGELYAHVGQFVLTAEEDISVTQFKFIIHGDSRQIFRHLRVEANGEYLGEAAVAGQYAHVDTKNFVAPAGETVVDLYAYVVEKVPMGIKQRVVLESLRVVPDKALKPFIIRDKTRSVKTDTITTGKASFRADDRGWQLTELLPVENALVLNFDAYALRDHMDLENVAAEITLGFDGVLPPAGPQNIRVYLYDSSTGEILEEKNFTFDHKTPGTAGLVYKNNFDMRAHEVIVGSEGRKYSIHVDIDELYELGLRPQTITASVTDITMISGVTEEVVRGVGLPVSNTLVAASSEQ